jgi:hypothetical protein
MPVSNTWDYRFAFRVEDGKEIPAEFRSAYERLAKTHGRPVYGLFTPPIRELTFIVSRWIPPRLILVFRESIAGLSLDSHSNQTHGFEVCRNDFLGFGIAEFLLNCWFKLRPGDETQKHIEIRFPSRVGRHYWELTRLLLDWCSGKEEAGNAVQRPNPVAGVPAKFASFVDLHTELGAISEFFYQPAMESRTRRGQSFANLLLLLTSRGIFALADQYRGGRSEYGIEMTYLPSGRLRTVEWTEPANVQSGAIEISMHGVTSRSRASWPVHSGLQPYALRWIRAVDSAIEESAPKHATEGGLTNPDSAEDDQCHHSLSLGVSHDVRPDSN